MEGRRGSFTRNEAVHLPCSNFFFFFHPSCLVIVHNTIIDEFQALIKSDADDFPPLPIPIIESFSTRGTRLFLFFLLSSFLFSSFSIFPLLPLPRSLLIRLTTRDIFETQHGNEKFPILEWRSDRSIDRSIAHLESCYRYVKRYIRNWRRINNVKSSFTPRIR